MPELRETDDRVIKEILDLSIYKLIQRLSPSFGKEVVYPEEPFDIYFHLLLIKDMFKNKEFIKVILEERFDELDNFW